MNNTRTIENIEFVPITNDELSKYFHKRIMKPLEEFKSLEFSKSIERNQFGYIRDKIGVLISEDEVYLSCELIFDDEDETIGDITYMLSFDIKKKKFFDCDFDYVVPITELEDEIVESIECADYLYVLKKFTQKIQTDKNLPKLISNLIEDVSDELQTDKNANKWKI